MILVGGAEWVGSPCLRSEQGFFFPLLFGPDLVILGWTGKH